MKMPSRMMLFLLFAAAVLPLRAQGGCVDSPEDPTIALAPIGAAGAAFAMFRARRKKN